MSGSHVSVVVDIGNSGLKAAFPLASSRESRDSLEPLASIAPQIVHGVWRRRSVANEATDSALSRKGTDESPRESCVDWEDPSAMDLLVHSIAAQRQPNSEGIGIDWWISSVHDPAATALQEAVGRTRPQDRWKRITRTDVPMPVFVTEPEKLGVDRLLAAWGAWIHTGEKGPVIAIQVGTALTVDFVDREGSFQGGAIMPGVPLALRLMAEGTNRLPKVAAPHDFESVRIPGKNTAEAMLAGVSASLIGGASWLIARYREQSASQSIPAVVSGGDGPSLVRWLPEPICSVDQLVLRAIATLLRRGSKSRQSD